nr:MAG TPA: hypothetical protein [Bacteriophage sp.]
MTTLKPIDKNNLDGVYGATAVALDWPENLSEKAKKTLEYLDGAIFLFRYLGRYVITNESLWLTDYGTDNMDDPLGGPWDDLDALEELDFWLANQADDLEELDRELNEE